jgi:hypothetical protein
MVVSPDTVSGQQGKSSTGAGQSASTYGSHSRNPYAQRQMTLEVRVRSG